MTARADAADRADRRRRLTLAIAEMEQALAALDVVGPSRAAAMLARAIDLAAAGLPAADPEPDRNG